MRARPGRGRSCHQQQGTARLSIQLEAQNVGQALDDRRVGPRSARGGRRRRRAIVVRRIPRVGDGDRPHARGLRGEDAVLGVLDRGAAGGPTRGDGPPRGRHPAQACRGRPPRRDARVGRAAETRALEDEVDQLAVGRGASARGQRAAKRSTACSAPAISGSSRAGAVLEPRTTSAEISSGSSGARRRRACSATTRASSCPSCLARRYRSSGLRAPPRAAGGPRPRRARSR